MFLDFGAQREPSSSDVKPCWRGLCFIRQGPGVATATGVTYGLNTRVTDEPRRNRCRGVLSDNQNGLPSPLSLGNTWTWIPVSCVTGQTQDGMKLSPHLLTPEHFTLIYPEQDACTCRPWIKVRHWRPGKRQTSLWSGPDRDAAQLLRQLLWVARPLFFLMPHLACKDLHRHTHIVPVSSRPHPGRPSPPRSAPTRRRGIAGTPEDWPTSTGGAPLPDCRPDPLVQPHPPRASLRSMKPLLPHLPFKPCISQSRLQVTLAPLPLHSYWTESILIAQGPALLISDMGEDKVRGRGTCSAGEGTWLGPKGVEWRALGQSSDSQPEGEQ